MQLSLRQASREARISKSTLARAVAAGRVSATRTEDGRLLFDPAELFRAYPPRQSATVSEPPQQAVDTAQNRPATDAEGHDATALETEIRLLRERLAEMKQERDEWREQAKALGNRPLLLAAPETTRDTPRRRWWPFRRAG